MIEVKTYTQLDETLIKEWETVWLSSSLANYINSPYWLLAAITAFKIKKYVIVALYKNNNLIAVAPLIEERNYGIRYKTLLPGDFVCGLPFLIIKNDKKILKALIDSLFSFGTIFFENIPEQFIRDIKRLTKNVSVIPFSINYYHSFVKDAKGNLIIQNREKILYKVRRIENTFILKQFDGTKKEALKTVFTIDSESRKQARGYNAFAEKQTREFYMSLAHNFKSHFNVHLLYFESRPIAYEIGFKIGKIYYGSQISYLKEYKKYTPGKVLLIKILENLSASGFEQIDFGSGDNSLKRDVTQDSQILYKLIFSKNTFIRTYLTIMNQSKKTIFELLQANPIIYIIYRRLKNYSKYK